VTAFNGIEFFAGFMDDGWREMWVCLTYRVSLARKFAETTWPASIP
jgi:hypothetical protein